MQFQQPIRDRLRFAEASAGKSIATSTAITAMTTKTSIKVIPLACFVVRRTFIFPVHSLASAMPSVFLQFCLPKQFSFLGRKIFPHRKNS